MSALRFAIIVVLLAGCAGTAQEPASSDVAESPMPETPTTDEITGLLTIDPTPGGKDFQGTWVEADDARYVLAYRPLPETFALQNKRVIATGKKWRPGKYEQHIDAPHFELATITLANGEQPYAEPPTTVLPAPTMRTLADAERSSARWGRFVGQLRNIAADDNGRGSATMTLMDGDIYLERLFIEDRDDGLYTVVCAIQREKGGIVAIQGVAVCAGDVEDCGSR